MITSGLSFRPLSGNYISQFNRGTEINGAEIHVSVPCRGTTFLNDMVESQYISAETKFPSPVGELHFSIRFTVL